MVETLPVIGYIGSPGGREGETYTEMVDKTCPTASLTSAILIRNNIREPWLDEILSDDDKRSTDVPNVLGRPLKLGPRREGAEALGSGFVVTMIRDGRRAIFVSSCWFCVTSGISVSILVY